jgi:hypothetical protein
LALAIVFSQFGIAYETAWSPKFSTIKEGFSLDTHVSGTIIVDTKAVVKILDFISVCPLFEQCAPRGRIHSINGMQHGQAIPEIVNDEPNDFERLQAALRLPSSRPTIVPTQARVKPSGRHSLRQRLSK